MWLAMHLPRHLWFDQKRWRLLRLAGVDIQRSEIRAPLSLTQFGELGRIHIGPRTFINTGLRIGVGTPAHIRIGADCAIGPNVSFEAMSHELVWTPERHWGGVANDITVGDRCWIGARAIILGGV